MSKITNDGLTRSGTGMLYSTHNMAIVGVKGLTNTVLDKIILQQHVSTLEMRDEIFTFESFINFVIFFNFRDPF